jgi:hypothetical protein
MQHGSQTWRELLGSLSVDEKRKITETLDIQAKTLERWISGYTELPRLTTLRRLLALLPAEKRTRFIELVQQDPLFSKYVGDHPLPGLKQGIPSTFYSRVLEANALTPDSLRFTTICQLVLLQAVGQLDPRHLGLLAIILKCTPPSVGKRVRTLSQQFSLGTLPWNTVIEQKTYFLGAESIAGQAVMASSPFVIQDRRNDVDSGFLPLHQDEYTMSTLAVPLQRGERIGGCLLVLSTQPNFFSPSVLTLVQQYGHLLVIALRDDELYVRHTIELQPVPSIQVQQQYLAHFHARVSAVIKQSHLNGYPKNLLEADQEVRQGIEAELLALMKTNAR